MVITFTSTEIQKNNENSKYTTINLGECENILKKYYNISEESKLYILKIDKEQKGKNYPQIEYQVFYPSISGKMEILNLSLCDGIYIELSIPIVINALLINIIQKVIIIMIFVQKQHLRVIQIFL